MELTALKGIGPKRAALFDKLGIHTVEDLLVDMPRRYEDRSTVVRLSELEEGQTALIRAEISSVNRPVRIRGGMTLLRVQAADASGSVNLVWHGRPYLARSLHPGDSFYFFGRFREKDHGFADPAIITEQQAAQGEIGLIPMYDLTSGLSQTMRRQAVRAALPFAAAVEDPVTETWRKEMGLDPISALLQDVHFPSSPETMRRSRRQMWIRMTLEEELVRFFLEKDRRMSRAMPIRDQSLDDFLQRLPFVLTQSQKETLQALRAKLIAPEPMNALLQGDVGSGKTVVAFALAEIVRKNGAQSALMAPTDVLARQHAQKAEALFPDGTVFLLTGGSRPDQRKSFLESALHGTPGLYIGTHALFQESVQFRHLALVMTDEQHRFGVMQRARLQEKLALSNTLVLSATPIPRTVDLVRWGALDLVRMRGRPPGRHPVQTTVIRAHQERAAYDALFRQICAGRQGYIVCPMIEEGDHDLAHWSVEAVETRIKNYAQRCGFTFQIETLSGRCSAEQKKETMHGFRTGKTQILIATTVIEVGVDVPNATVMLILGAERFGLAQLHQLRGRVGRGTEASYCLLLSTVSTKRALSRLRTLETTEDGWEIALRDLRERGSGDRLGTAQHGLIPDQGETDEERKIRIGCRGFIAAHAGGWKTWKDLPKPLKGRIEKRIDQLRHVTLN